MTTEPETCLLTIGLVAMSGGLIASGTGVRRRRAEQKGHEACGARSIRVIARKLKLSGTVKLTAVVAGGGQVTSVEIIGGHPILILAAEDAAKQFVFQAASAESREILTFVFAPQ